MSNGIITPKLKVKQKHTAFHFVSSDKCKISPLVSKYNILSFVAFPSQHLDRQLKEINTFIRADSRISANPIMKLLFGDPRLFLALLPQASLIHSTSLWSCREKVSLLSLTHYVEQNDGRDNLPVLWRFLHKVKKKINHLQYYKHAMT